MSREIVELALKLGVGGIFSIASVLSFYYGYTLYGIGAFAVVVLAWTISPEAKWSISSIYGLASLFYFIDINWIVGITYLAISLVSLARGSRRMWD